LKLAVFKIRELRISGSGNLLAAGDDAAGGRDLQAVLNIQISNVGEECLQCLEPQGSLGRVDG
jgi:hypothetical protein